MKNSLRNLVTGSAVAATLALSLTLPSAANAQGRASTRLRNMQQHQQAAIRQDMKSGALTKKQANEMVKGERTIKETIAKDKANGPLTKTEAAQLKKETQAENAAIKQGANATTPPATMPPTKQQ